MKQIKVAVGDRVLVQSRPDIREHAIVKDITDNGVVVRLSDYKMKELRHECVLKNFSEDESI